MFPGADMTDAGFSLFKQLASYSDLEDLIENGEAESLFLEYKAPCEPQLCLTQGVKRVISGESTAQR